MKEKRFSKGLRKTISGSLAVVLAATAIGPLFTVMSHAESFDYIEELKNLKNGSSFSIMEIVPDGKQTAMGYLAAGNEPLDKFSVDAGTVEGWKKADRASYMSSVYSDLSGKGIIGNTVSFPLTKGMGYKEYFPWEVTLLDDGNYYYNGDLTNGVPNAGAKALKEMDLATQDQSTVKGRFEVAGEGQQAQYRMNASYSPAKKLFFFNEFNSKFGPSTGLWQVNTKLANYAAGDNLNFNSTDKSISVSSGGVTHLAPVFTTYASKNGYIMEVERDTEYELTFHVDVNNGGKFYVAAYETSAGSLSSLLGSDTLYPDKLYETATDTSVNESASGDYTITIKTSAMTDLTKKLFLQLCFGVDKTKNTTATFSDIYFGEPRGHVQDVDRFHYEAEDYADTANDFWYDLKFARITESDWDTMDFEGVGIYEENNGVKNAEGVWVGDGTFTCIGVAGVDSAEELDLDYDKAMQGGYYVAIINDEIYDTDGKGLQTVTATRDDYHKYRAEPKYEAGTSNLSFNEVDGGYFKALDITYSYVDDEGAADYIFVPDNSAADSITVYSQKAYFANYVTNNDLFKYGALDYDSTDNFSVKVNPVTTENLNDNDSYRGDFMVADMIVISAGTGTSINSTIDKVNYTSDITQEMKEAILEAASATYKIPVVVDARLIDSSYANAISSETCPVLYSLVRELINRNTENSEEVSILNGGVSQNIYAFSPSHIGGTAASIATSEIKRTISASAETSPYYDVYYQIFYENNLRSATNKLPNGEVNEASCLRCIINYKGRRIMGSITNLRVLDIEPYTNDPKESYYYPQSRNTVHNNSYVDEYIIGNWLPAGYFKDDDGHDVTITEANAKDYITLTRMSTAELNGTGDKIIENYDLVYVGAAVGNLEKQMTNKNGVDYVDYNDDSAYFQNKLYSGIGDAYTVGNINYNGSNLGDIVSGAVEGNTLAGLLNCDYNLITSNIWYISPNYDFSLRTTGNDITRDVMNQLREFANAGFPVVFADDLTESKTISSSYAVKVTTKEVYRGTTGYDHFGKETRDPANGYTFKTKDANSGTSAVYFTFLKAELIGDVPRGIVPVFTWKWKYGVNGEAVAGNHDDFDRNEEPIADDSKLTTDGSARNWYSTIGDWNYLGDYKNQNGDDFLSGLSLGKDESSLKYPTLNSDYRFYCDVTFRMPVSGEADYGVSVSDPVKAAFLKTSSGLTIHSNEVKYTSSQQSFKVEGTRPGQNKAVTVDINPDPANYNVYLDDGELKWRHHAKYWAFWSDCDCGSRELSHSDNKLHVKNTKCEDYYLHLDGIINGEKKSTEDANGPNCTYTNTCTWTTRIVKSNNIANTAWVKNNSGIVEGGSITVKQKGFEKVSDFAVDNTSFLYQFMAEVYNKIEYTPAELAQGGGRANKDPLPNVFIMSNFEDATGKTALKNRLDAIQIPNLSVDENALVSYPAALPDRNLNINFVIYNAKNTNSTNNYKVYLYIDANHDAVFSDYEETPITALKKGTQSLVKDNGVYVVKSSVPSGGDYNEYTLTKVLPSSYVGIIPWKLIVVDKLNETIHDSYIGYAYRKAGVGEGTVIKAVQILPADHWSNSVSKRYNAVNQLIAEYDKPVIRGIWRPTYDTSNLYSSSYDPVTNPTTVAAAEAGNAYMGSIFLGTGAGRDGTIYKEDPNIEGDHDNEAWYLRDANHGKDISKKSNLIYTYNQADFKNDAFYQLCIAEDSKLDRTVYYEDFDNELDVNENSSQLSQYISEHYADKLAALSQDRIKYRTHVEFWVNPKGPKVPKTDSQGNVLTDYFGNTVYAYEQYDFELDIALTDIYELDFYWYQNQADVDDPTDFLSQYDMLILGFGDSYGKTARQNGALFNLVASNLGFGMYAAKAVRKFVDSGKPMLFCHDTTNGNVNFIDYFALNAVSWLSGITQTIEDFWNNQVKETATKIWYWIRNTVRRFIGKEPLNVPSPSVDQERELNNKVADNRTRDGYYNNLVLRYPLKLDRYGITYEIYKSMTAADWEAGNFRNAHKYSYLLGYNYTAEDGTTKTLVSAESDSHVISEAEMLAHGFTIAYEPGSAKKTTLNSRGDKQVQYTHYNNAAGGTKIVNGETVDATFTGDQVKADYIIDTQGFTKWTIARYLSNSLINDSSVNDNNYYMPITVPGSVKTAHRGPYITRAITQVGKGSITTYPYDVNSSKFGGSIDPNGDGKIRIMPTHDQYYQINLNDGDTTVWYCLADSEDVTTPTYDLLPNDCANSYYIFTSGNVTYTGAGHANIFSEEEAMLFLNTLVGAYRASKEKPEVHFRDDTDKLNIEYQVLTENNQGSGSQESFVDKEITGVKIVDPNITGSASNDLVVNFYSDSELKHKITGITLRTVNDNGTLGGETISYSTGGYHVITDVTYYFETPQEVIDGLAENESYVVYAQSAVGGESSDIKSIEYRRLALSDLT